MADGKQEGKAHKLDLLGLNRVAYLVKVPNYVADSWRAAAEKGGQGSELAEIRLAPTGLSEQAEEPSADPTERREAAPVHQPILQPSTTGSGYLLRLTGSAMSDMPHTFRLQQQGQGSEALVALQEGALQTRLVAQVQQRFDTAVLHDSAAGQGQSGSIDPKYRAIARARNEAASKKSRTMQVIDNPSAARAAASPLAAKTKRVEKQDWEHRARIDKDKLENRLFKLFEKQAHWKFAELVKATDQPAVWLKEVLSGMALNIKRGPYMGNWELKKEYRVGDRPS